MRSVAHSATRLINHGLQKKISALSLRTSSQYCNHRCRSRNNERTASSTKALRSVRCKTAACTAHTLLTLFTNHFHEKAQAHSLSANYATVGSMLPPREQFLYSDESYATKIGASISHLVALFAYQGMSEATQGGHRNLLLPLFTSA